MRTRLLHTLGPLLVLLMFAGAIWLLHGELKHYRYHDILQSLAQIPRSHVWLAVGLTVLNYIILVAYDLLAIRSIGHPLSLGKVAVASFIGYVSSFNFGYLLGGSSVRYRLYSGWGLSAAEIVKLLTFLSLTFWIGFAGLAGLTFLWDPISIPPRFHLPLTTVRPLGGVLLLMVAGYLVLGVGRKGPIRFRDWEFSLPSLRVSVLQIAIATADMLVAAGVLYLLMPPSVDIGYLPFLSIYLLAIVVVLFTHVPGGIGVFEVTVLLLLSPAQPTQVVGSLLAFRAVYCLFPLALAMLLLGANELVIHRLSLRRLLDPVGQIAPLAPWLLSLFLFATGAVLLFSGATPWTNGRLAWVHDVFPLPLFELSHFLGSVVGMGLLLLARGLQRRLDSAYWVSMVLLAAGMVASLLSGFNYQQALVLLLMLAILAPARPYFYRKGSLLRHPLSPGWVAGVLLVLLCSIWIGLFAHKHLQYSDQLWWQFSFHGDAPRFLRASAGAAVLLLSYSLASLLRPAAATSGVPGENQLDDAARIVARSESASANLALLGDKRLLFDEQKSGMVMYGVVGRNWVAMGDPVGPADVLPELAWRFRELCDRYDGRPSFYQIGAELLPVYLDLGLSLTKLGEEARVPLETFSLEGKANVGLRHTLNNCHRQNCSFAVMPPAEVAGRMPELKAVSDAWLSHKKGSEKGFSLGYFEPDYLARFPAAVVLRHSRIVAFANLWCGAEAEELSGDLMRYLPDAPRGVMDYLFTELMLWGKHEGYRWFNLGMAPLSGLDSHSLAPLWSRLGALVFRHGEHFYHFRGLRQYKEKFNPEWRPKYLASPGGLALPRILADIARLISGAGQRPKP